MCVCAQLAAFYSEQLLTLLSLVAVALKAPLINCERASKQWLLALASDSEWLIERCRLIAIFDCERRRTERPPAHHQRRDRYCHLLPTPSARNQQAAAAAATAADDDHDSRSI